MQLFDSLIWSYLGLTRVPLVFSPCERLVFRSEWWCRVFYVFPFSTPVEHLCSSRFLSLRIFFKIFELPPVCFRVQHPVPTHSTRERWCSSVICPHTWTHPLKMRPCVLWTWGVGGKQGHKYFIKMWLRMMVEERWDSRWMRVCWNIFGAFLRTEPRLLHRPAINPIRMSRLTLFC